MLAVSALCPTSGFPVGDDQLSYEQIWNCLEPFGYLDNELQNSKNSGETSSTPQQSRKKLHHNASEKERRKRVNDLYSDLRSLLPGVDIKKKLSIPSTIAQALKYIPQLQNQVDRLVKRREEILSSISNQTNELAWCPATRNEGLEGQSVPAISVSQIGDREAVIQLCTSNIKKISFSNFVQSLERDELHILNASTSNSSRNKVFYTLHVQVKPNRSVQCEVLRKKIISLC